METACAVNLLDPTVLALLSCCCRIAITLIDPDRDLDASAFLAFSCLVIGQSIDAEWEHPVNEVTEDVGASCWSRKRY